MKKNCGSCRFFVKWKNNKNWGGLCEEFDLTTWTDHGRGCKTWKNKKYVRKRISYSICNYYEDL